MKPKNKTDHSKVLNLGKRNTQSNSSRLPNQDKMRIPPEKFTRYVLDYDKAKDKAIAFQTALGYNKANASSLISNIASNVNNFEAVPKGDDGYGMRYEVIMKLTGANGKVANVLTAWLDDRHKGEVRLISAYIDKPKGGGK